ncbi:MAG: aminoacyl-tRNA hydrolase [Planctomycetes bacterium]|jgi:PTH1 family peptidyl-tRNA hydrolase|nr:aminoacyl-tRNA hydrolase [Planctomycetota bacterium]
MKLVVGLGNPGKRYDGTRHNVGFAVVDALASAPDVQSFQDRFDADVAEWHDAGEKILLMKPQTFMNLSGRSVRQAVDFYQMELTDLLIVCDDMALPLGKLRFRARGTHGGHNGLRDIQQHLGTTDYARLRIGVEAPDKEKDAVDHVLGKFKPSERPVVADAISLAAQGVAMWVGQGIQKCMNQYNA